MCAAGPYVVAHYAAQCKYFLHCAACAAYYAATAMLCAASISVAKAKAS